MTMFQNLNRSMDPRGRLQARCAGCGRTAFWGKAAACRIFGPDATPYEVRRRLKCTDCGAARAEVWI